MTRRQTSSTNPRPRCWQRLALMLFGCAHVLAAVPYTQPTTAFGQDNSSEPVLTEIWMEGDDLVLTRNIPQDRPPGWDSDADVARRMVEIAQRRYWEGDQATAIWLCQWAQQLTNGRIGSNEFAKFTAVPAPAHLPLAPSDDRLVLLPVPADVYSTDPPGSRMHSTADLVGPPESQLDRGVPLVKVEPSLSPAIGQPELLPTSDPLVGHAELEKSGQPVENRQPHLKSPADRESAIPPGRTVRMIDNLGRQVVLVVPDSGNIGFANQANRQSPVESTWEPLTVAAISFVLGTVFCGLLCTVLLMVPVRLSNQRRTGLELQAGRATLPADPASEAPSSASLSKHSRVPKPAFKTISEQNKASSVVEEFYENNVALLKQLQNHSHPSAGDGKGKKHYHIGAAHG